MLHAADIETNGTYLAECSFLVEYRTSLSSLVAISLFTELSFPKSQKFLLSFLFLVHIPSYKKLDIVHSGSQKYAGRYRHSVILL
jgi:hypothetical protein